MKPQFNIHQSKPHFSQIDDTEIARLLAISNEGLSDSQVEFMRHKYGSNRPKYKFSNTLFYRFFRAFINPFSSILFVIAIISFITGVILQAEVSKNCTTTIIIISMLFIGGLIRFSQDVRSQRATKKLYQFLNRTAKVKRNGCMLSIPVCDIVIGDHIYLSAGDLIPCDLRIIEARNLHVSESSLTGESGSCEKISTPLGSDINPSTSSTHTIAFMSTTVLSGSGQGIAIAVGNATVYSVMGLKTRVKTNANEHGANAISFVFIRFMLIMVSLVFLFTQLKRGDLLSSFLFSLSVAIGLTPELLPLVITTCLAKGASALSKKHTLIKNINATQGFGSMDVLCMDKTGTITNDSILLEYYMDILGHESQIVLDNAFLNSFYHSAACSPIDNAILAVQTMPNKAHYFKMLTADFQKIDEIPFGYDRKYVSILVANNHQHRLIMKGDIEQVLAHCTSIEYKGQQLPIKNTSMDNVLAVVKDMLEEGMKVIAIAKKELTSCDMLVAPEEKDLTLLGYIAFFDAPKKTAAQSIASLKSLAIQPKILTGDNLLTAKSICKRIGIDATATLTGTELQTLTHAELQTIVEKVMLFAELTPQQKVMILSTLQANGHTVGFLGDGLNDIPAICKADIGISVDTAVDKAKDVADVILLHKDLTVLTDNILEGRKTFVNMLNYIKITASSNLGNIISIVVASVCLPFMPIASTQILLLNLLYDLLCGLLPWDSVEKEDLATPKQWSGKTLPRFMLIFGGLSSIFDMITFLFLYFVLCPFFCNGKLFTSLVDPSLQVHAIALFQTGWFLESMWTQILILHILKTKHFSAWKTTSSKPFLWVTLFGIVSFTSFTFMPIASYFGFTALPFYYYLFLFAIALFYMIAATTLKKWYIKQYHNLI